MELRSITVETLAAFAQALRAEERCTETIKQYTRSVRQFAAWLAPETVAAGSAGGWKAELLRRGLSPATVNSKLAGLNRFFRFLGWMDCTVKPLRLQRRLFRSPDRELSRAEYGRLLSAARGLGRERLGLLMEAICATGIRVSEVKYLTMEAARPGPGGGEPHARSIEHHVGDLLIVDRLEEAAAARGLFLDGRLFAVVKRRDTPHDLAGPVAHHPPDGFAFGEEFVPRRVENLGYVLIQRADPVAVALVNLLG